MYTASSVINSIRNSNNCEHEFLDYIRCPRDRCNVNPANCSSGKARTCHQYINVFDASNNLSKIVFRFTISQNNPDGFVSEEDSQLQELFNKQIINRTSLVQVTVRF